MLAYWNYVAPTAGFPEAKRAAQRALDLDPGLAEGHTALAFVHYEYEWLFADAGREFQEAIRLNPSSVAARFYFLEFLLAMGKIEEAEEQLAVAQKLDPLSVRVSFDLAVKFFFERDFDRAVEWLQKTISMDPNNAIAYGFLGTILWHKKMPVQAFNASEKANALEGVFSQQEMADMRRAYEVSGYSGFLRKQNDLTQQHLARGKYQSPLLIALNYALAGANSETLDWLERAVQEHTPWLPELKMDPAWDSVRSDPRFIAILKKMGLEK